MMLQASHLSNVHDYFDTTRTEDPNSLSFYESFKATFLKGSESTERQSALLRHEGSKPSRDSKRGSRPKDPYEVGTRSSYTKKVREDSNNMSADEPLFPIQEDQLEMTASRHGSNSRSISDLDLKQESMLQSSAESAKFEKSKTGDQKKAEAMAESWERKGGGTIPGSYDSKGLNTQKTSSEERHGQTEAFSLGERKPKLTGETGKATSSSQRTVPRVTVQHIDKEDSFRKSIKYTLLLMMNKRMLILLPQIFWTGISIAYWSGLVATIVARTIPDRDENQ